MSRPRLLLFWSTAAIAGFGAATAFYALEPPACRERTLLEAITSKPAATWSQACLAPDHLPPAGAGPSNLRAVSPPPAFSRGD